MFKIKESKFFSILVKNVFKGKFIKINKNKVIKILFSNNFRSKISLEAKLTIYTKRIINPPKKIKNKIKENHLLLVKIQRIEQIFNVWEMIIVSIKIGWEANVIRILKKIKI